MLHGLDPIAVFFEEGCQLLRRTHGAGGGFLHAMEEKVEPCFPIALGTHKVEKTVVLRPVLFEEQAEVQERV